MAIPEENSFAKNDVFPSWFANAIQRFLTTAAPAFQLTRQDATHVQVTAGSETAAAVISIAAKWRWIEATINRAHPGGAAGTWDIYVVAAANKIEAGGIDATNRAFSLRILKSGETPTIEAGVVDIFRKVGSLQWSGTEITRVDQTVPAMATHAHRHATGEPDAIAPADIGAATTASVTAEEVARIAADALKAPLASPGLTGTPTAPTAAVGTSTTQVATTAFVQGALTMAKSAIATEQSRENVAYGLLATPDEVTVTLPENGLLFVTYLAEWIGSAAAARAALFLGANQIKTYQVGSNVPVTQAALSGVGSVAPLFTYSGGLVSQNQGIPAGAASTGQVVGFSETNEMEQELAGVAKKMPNIQAAGGPCCIFAAAGTYKISVQFKVGSGKISVKNRKLLVWTFA